MAREPIKDDLLIGSGDQFVGINGTETGVMRNPTDTTSVKKPTEGGI